MEGCHGTFSSDSRRSQCLASAWRRLPEEEYPEQTHRDDQDDQGGGQQHPDEEDDAEGTTSLESSCAFTAAGLNGPGQPSMDAVVAVAISVLAVVFVSSLVALIVVCRHRYCSNKDHLSRQLQDSRPDIHLIHSQNETADMELDDVRLHPDIEKILADEQWVDDATGLVPHCLAVLKTCHQLTERLVTVSVGSVRRPAQSQRQMVELAQLAQKVGPRVDDVVRAMYPPLDPRLLEARSLVALIVVCRHRYCSNKDHLSRQLQDSRPDIHLIHSQNETADMELDDVRLHPDIEKILADEQWVDDATGLVPHCLAVLKTCHQLTERLVTVSVGSVRRPAQSQRQMVELAQLAQKVGPRVDDVVRAMYPPLDPRLLEARCTALVLSVVHLTLVMRTLCGLPSSPGWIDEYLAHAETHIQVLREAGLAADASLQQGPQLCEVGQAQQPSLSLWKATTDRQLSA
ncbi:putative transmembrane protein [Ixodes scapularis]